MSLTADKAVAVICDLVLRERIRFKRGELAQAHIDLGSALRDLFTERVGRCPHCKEYQRKIEGLQKLLGSGR